MLEPCIRITHTPLDDPGRRDASAHVFPTTFVLVAANIASNPKRTMVYIHSGLVIMIRKSPMFSYRLRSPTIGTGQLSRLNQRCRSRKQRDARVLPTHTQDETMRGGAINNAWQWLEQREERRIMAILPMQPLPLARLALIPLSSFFSATDFYSVTLAGGKFRGLRLEIASRTVLLPFLCPPWDPYGGLLSRLGPLFRLARPETSRQRRLS